MSTDDRFTPRDLLDFRDAVWPEGTDTDPAWHPRSFSTARVRYTVKEDGLKQTWFGRVWLNPPWSDPDPWIRRLVVHRRQLSLVGVASTTKPEGILCVRNDPATAWWEYAWANASAVAFPPKRVRYHQMSGRKVVRMATPTFTTALFYYGPYGENYVRVAREHGYYPTQLQADKGPVIPNELRRKLLDAVHAHARSHPGLTIGGLLDRLRPEVGEGLALSLTIADLAPKAPAGDRRRPNQGLAKRVRTVQRWIETSKLKELRSSEVMAKLDCSRQTALRTIASLPNLRPEGSHRYTRYVVTK